MARTALAIQKLNQFTGVNLTFSAVDAVNGMQVNNTGKCIVIVRAEGTSGATITFASRPDLNQRTGDAVQAIAGDNVRVFGPFGDSSLWGDGTNLFMDFAGVIGPNITIAVAQY